jgi:pyruvate/2-oxoglutarate dehydrogenase complex dihydrolipoamide dehydrogenase (E3) component
MVNELVEIHLAKFKASGAELVMGEARFTQPKTVDVALNAGGTRQLHGNRVFINVGTRARIPNVPGLADARPMTHVEALNLERLPEHLVILGGGYVGLELAQAMRRFGSRVTIVQHGPRLLDKEDADVSAGLLELMHDEGVEVLLNSEVLKNEAAGFPAMQGNVAFLMKDVVLLAVSVYLLQQDLARVSLPEAERREWQEVGGSRAFAVGEMAAK